MGTIVSATTTALGLSGQRNIAKTRTNVLWAAVRITAAAESRIYRSTNGGTSWSQQIVFDDAEAMSIRIVPGPDGRDWLIGGWVLDESGVTPTTVRTKVWRLFDDGTRAVEVGSSIAVLESTSRQARVAVDGVTIGSSLYVVTVWSQDNGTNTAIYKGHTRWTSAERFGPTNVGYVHHRNNTGGAIANPSINARRVGLFPHSQPDFLIAWSQDHVSGGNEKRVYFLRLRNSGGSWVLDSVQTVFQGGYGPVASIWTGREHVTVAATDDEPTAVKAWFCGVTGADRFRADPPSLAQGNIEFLSVSADPDTNDVWLTAAGATDDLVKAVKYDRTTDTWGAWVQASADVLADNRGNALPLTIGNVVDYVYTVSLGAPNVSVRSGVAAVTNRKPFQPTWQTAAEPYNRSATRLLDWDHTDPDGDAQQAYRLRRAQVISGVQGAWSWWNGTGWQGTETHVASATESHTLPSGWAAADGDVWAFQVATRDADLWSAYSGTLYLTGSTLLVAAITAPANGATVTTREFTVAWTPSAPGGALIEFLTAGEVVEAIRTTETNGATVRPDIDDDATYTLRVTLYDAAGLAGTPASISVSMAWPSPPRATLSVDVAQRVDSQGRTADAGLAVSWVTAAPAAGEPAAVTLDLYRYAVADFAEQPVPLSGMTKVLAAGEIDGAFEDLGVPGDTLTAYVGVTVSADGSIARSDVETAPAPPPPSPTFVRVAQLYLQSIPATADLLTWAPPGYPNYTGFQTVAITNPNLDFLDLGSTPTILDFQVVMTRRLGIRTNSHLVIIGAEWNIATTVNGPGALGREILGILDNGAPIPGQTVHIEGVYAHGYYCAGDIHIAAPSTIMQVQNCRWEQGMAGMRTGQQHPDMIQPYGGVGELRCDKLTGLLFLQGFFLPRQPVTTGPISGTRWFRRINMRHNPATNTEAIADAATVGIPNGAANPDWPQWQLHVADDPNTGPDPASGPIRIDNGTVMFRHRTQQITSTSQSGWAQAPTNGITRAFDATLGLWYVNYGTNIKYRNWADTGPGRLYEILPASPMTDYVSSALAGMSYTSPGYGYTG